MPFAPGSIATIRVDIEGEVPTRPSVRKINRSFLADVAKRREVRSVTLTAKGLDAQTFDSFHALMEFVENTDSELEDVTIDVQTNPPTAPRTPRGGVPPHVSPLEAAPDQAPQHLSPPATPDPQPLDAQDPSAPAPHSARDGDPPPAAPLEAAPRQAPTDWKKYFAIPLSVALLAVVCGALPWSASPSGWETPHFTLENTVNNDGWYDGCRAVEKLTATVAHPEGTTVALLELEIGDQAFMVEACPSTVAEPCRTTFLFQDRALRLTQYPSADGKRLFVLEGFVGCKNASVPQNAGKVDLMMENVKVALPDRVMTFQLSGAKLESRTDAHVHVEARQGRMVRDVADSHVVFHERTSTAVVRSSLIPEIDALLLRNGGEFRVNSSCPPKVHSSVAAAKDDEVHLCINVAVDKRCHDERHAPEVRAVDAATGLFTIKRQHKLPRGCGEAELGSEVPGTHASVGYVVVLGAPQKRDAPAHFRLPLLIGDTAVSVDVDGHRLWSAPGTPLHVNVMGPAYAGKSSESGLMYCYNVPLRSLETANKCLLSSENQYERGQDNQFTHTTVRLTRRDGLGGRITDNAGSQLNNVNLNATERNLIHDEASLRNYLSGNCPDDCSPGDCRENNCNKNRTLRCADVELFVLPVDSVFSNEVKGPRHPLHHDALCLKWVRRKEVQCRQPAVLLINVKAAFDNISASKVIADPAISMRSTLYRDAQLELCSKARDVLQATENMKCVATSIRPPASDMNREEFGRYLEGARAVEKALHTATTGNSEKAAATP